MKLYQAFKGQKGQNEQPIIDLATKILAESQMAAFLSRPDTFSPGGLDAAMVQCAVMSEATSVGLAEFAKLSSANKALITKLLADPILMRDMVMVVMVVVVMMVMMVMMVMTVTHCSHIYTFIVLTKMILICNHSPSSSRAGL